MNFLSEKLVSGSIDLEFCYNQCAYHSASYLPNCHDLVPRVALYYGHVLHDFHRWLSAQAFEFPPCFVRQQTTAQTSQQGQPRNGFDRNVFAVQRQL